MRVDIQWATQTPSESVTIDSSEWAGLPKKPLPDGNEVLDQEPGWLQRWNIQGCKPDTADHHAMEDQADGSLKVWSWCDDPEDYPDGDYYGTVTTFRPAYIHPEERFCGKWHYEQHFTIYAAENTEHWRTRNSVPRQNVTIRPWSEFPYPDEAIVRHGVWLRDDQHEESQRLESKCGVFEWIDGLPAEEIIEVNGVSQLRPQAPLGRFLHEQGSIRYTLRSTARTNGIHASSFRELAMETSADTPTTSTSQNYSHGDARSEFVWTSPSGSPNFAQWPTGTYFGQVSIFTNDDVPNFSFGMRAAGGAAGHVARVDSGLTADQEAKEMTDSLFTGTGDKAFTLGSVSWSSGAAGDRAEVLMAVSRGGSGHGNAGIEVEVNRVDTEFFEGPWAVSGPAPGLRTLSMLGVGI